MRHRSLRKYLLKCVPVVWLLYMIDTMIASHCPGNQITWVDKNDSFVRCSPCPPCLPGQQYTIPCNTKAVEGTMANCVNCPKGKYSSSFDTEPCRHCRVCSKRYIKRNCTLYRNAKCGDCLPGYFRDDSVFDCIKCDKCCHDGKDKTPPGCKKVGMCKPRLHGCPPTPKPTASKRFTGWMTTKKNKNKFTSTPKTRPAEVNPSKKDTYIKGQLTSQSTATTPTSLSHQDKVSKEEPNVNAYGKTEQEDSEKNGYKMALGGLSCFIFGILCSGAGYFIYIKYKEKQVASHRPEFNRSLSGPVVYEPVPTINDRTLADFMENGRDAFEAVCTHLNKERDGMYDFERVGNRLGLTRTQIQSLLNHVRQNPTQELIDTLQSGNPQLTVKQFAKVVKDVKRNDVYGMLEPFFEKS